MIVIVGKFYYVYKNGVMTWEETYDYFFKKKVIEQFITFNAILYKHIFLYMFWNKPPKPNDSITVTNNEVRKMEYIQ